jgi:hypothetical protein
MGDIPMTPPAALFCSLSVGPIAPNTPLGYSPTLEYIKNHPMEIIPFEKICHRFKLVRRDLEDALADEVKVIVGQLQNLEYESDSSGMSGPASLGHLRVLKADEESLNRKRKSEDEDGHKNEDD